MFINKADEIAIENEGTKCKTLIVDSTHTKVMYNPKIPREILADCSKNLRKYVYKIDEKI